MNPYNIGDRIWTAKRGFGTIVSKHESFFFRPESTPKRPYGVAFDIDRENSGFCKSRYPKRKNIQSEEYGKYMMKLSDQIDAETLKAINNPGQCTVDQIIDHGKKDWDSLLLKCSASIGKTEPVTPKFKVGDIVYYESKTTGKPGKYEVTSVYPDLTLRLIPTLGSEQNPPFCVMVDPNLVRHWIPTKITHLDTMYKCQKEYTIKDLPGLYYVGKHLWGLDAFFQDAGNGKIVIWYGIKGDDIS